MKKIFLLFLFFVGLNFYSEKLFCTKKEALSYEIKFDELSKIKINWGAKQSEIESKLHNIFLGLKEIARSCSVSEEEIILQFFEQKCVFVNWYFNAINTKNTIIRIDKESCENIDKCINLMKKLLGEILFTKFLNIVFVKTTYGYHLFELYKQETRTTALDIFRKRLGGGWDFELWFYYDYAISKIIECGAKKYKELNTGIPTEIITKVVYENIS